MTAPFSLDALQNLQITEAGSTEVTPVPMGDHNAYIEKYELVTWQKRDDPTVSGVKLLVTWNIEDQAVRDLLGRDKVLVQQDVMLEVDENGSLPMGKGRNVDLNRLRAALGLNVAGKPFGFPMLVGQMARVTVKHDPDKNDPNKVYARVKAVGARV